MLLQRPDLEQGLSPPGALPILLELALMHTSPLNDHPEGAPLDASLDDGKRRHVTEIAADSGTFRTCNTINPAPAELTRTAVLPQGTGGIVSA